MSSKHFLIHVAAGLCTINDQKSTNGTWIKGNRIETAILRPGDQLTAGMTEFLLRLTRAPNRETFGSWSAAPPPQEWDLVPGQGFKLAGAGAHSNIVFAEDSVPENLKTEDYVTAQRGIILQYMPSATISEISAAHLSNAGAALQTDIKFTAPAGESAILKQFYVRRLMTIGIVTTTMVETERGQAELVLEGILASARFESAEDNQEAANH